MDTYLPNLTQYLVFEKKENKNHISLSLGNILKDLKEQVKSIEIYYNPDTTVLDHDIEAAKILHIVTQKEV